MPGITFKITGEGKAVLFDQRIHGYLRKQDSKNMHQFGLLLDLDHYGYNVLKYEEIKELIIICDRLIQLYNDEFIWEHNRVRKFSKKLQQLCLRAINEQKDIQSIGD